MRRRRPARVPLLAGGLESLQGLARRELKISPRALYAGPTAGRLLSCLVSREPSNRLGRVELAHYAGLDGLRGIAVLAVLLYHGGVSWAPGGFLGVEVFFVLSGFLITSLLVAEWQRSATIALRRVLGPARPAAAAGAVLPGRRDRRLLPGRRRRPMRVPGLQGRRHLHARLLRQLAPDRRRRSTTSPPSAPVSPLEHTWSLAIEEQFYLVWPLRGAGRARRCAGRRGAEPAHAAGRSRSCSRSPSPARSASALDMALLFDGGQTSTASTTAPTRARSAC